MIIFHWLHLLFAFFWFGGAMWANAIVGPALGRLPGPIGGAAGAAIGEQARKIIPAVAGLTILFGLISGIAFGPIKSFSLLVSSTYGLTFLVAIVVSVVLASWGGLVTRRAAEAIALAPEPEKPAAVARLMMLSRVEIGLFLVVFTCMVLLRYGR